MQATNLKRKLMTNKNWQRKI